MYLVYKHVYMNFKLIFSAIRIYGESESNNVMEILMNRFTQTGFSALSLGNLAITYDLEPLNSLSLHQSKALNKPFLVVHLK